MSSHVRLSEKPGVKFCLNNLVYCIKLVQCHIVRNKNRICHISTQISPAPLYGTRLMNWLV